MKQLKRNHPPSFTRRKQMTRNSNFLLKNRAKSDEPKCMGVFKASAFFFQCCPREIVRYLPHIFLASLVSALYLHAEELQETNATESRTVHCVLNQTVPSEYPNHLDGLSAPTLWNMTRPVSIGRRSASSRHRMQIIPTATVDQKPTKHMNLGEIPHGG